MHWILLTVAGQLVKWMWWLEFLLRTGALNCYSRLFCLRLILESIPGCSLSAFPSSDMKGFIFFQCPNHMNFIEKFSLGNSKPRHHLEKGSLWCYLATLSKGSWYLWNAASPQCFGLPKGSLFFVCNILTIIAEV